MAVDALTFRGQQDRRNSADVLQKAAANDARTREATERIRKLIAHMNEVYRERLDGRRRG